VGDGVGDGVADDPPPQAESISKARAPAPVSNRMSNDRFI
jgi:hypothetical protein